MARKVEGEKRMGRPRKKASAVIAQVAFRGVAVRLLTTTHTLYSGTPGATPHSHQLTSLNPGGRIACRFCSASLLVRDAAHICAAALIHSRGSSMIYGRLCATDLATRVWFVMGMLGGLGSSPLSLEKDQSMRALVPMEITVALKKLSRGMPSSTMPPAPFPNLPCTDNAHVSVSPQPIACQPLTQYTSALHTSSVMPLSLYPLKVLRDAPHCMSFSISQPWGRFTRQSAFRGLASAETLRATGAQCTP